MIEVGDYIRNNDGGIGKITKVISETIFYVQYYDNIPFKTDIYETKIKSHSKNIIDLIEVGDYVNEMRVIATENRGRYNEEKQKDEKVILAENYDEWTENGVISNEEIKTILTHEMYEQNCYKVGED